ncbi:uncharacterized protein BJX67DRAFT_365538 [Aspergillus lucknowensis]|uniref:Uncharacterized protein n=1 Tax=Aspergillus lucknowensis TaxID=176173 RepID=A0ABR4LE40_9EURO
MTPAFQSYTLTSLDHLIQPIYLAGSSRFDLKGKDKTEVLNRLKTASDRLLVHLPFLGGFVVPAPPVDGKINAYEVRNCEDNGDPFLVVEEHPASTPLLLNGRLNPDFLPHAPAYQPQDPCPVLRNKANIVGDALFLVQYFHHTVMDGLGGSVMCRTLAQLCRNPDTPANELPTSVEAQKRMRQHLLKLESATPSPLRWDPKPLELTPLDLSDPRNTTWNCRYQVRVEKVEILRAACLMVRQAAQAGSAKGGGDVYLSPSLIVGAVFGLCSYRARQAARIHDGREPNIVVAVNLRKQLGLPSTYMGNALVVVQCPLDAQIIPDGNTSISHAPSGVHVKDLNQVCNIALYILKEIKAYTPDYVAGMLATLGALTDRTLVGLPWSGLAFSDTHKMPQYDDYGPLGEVQDFFIPGNAISGACWMLATKPLPGKKSLDWYELQIALESAAMQELERDRLFQWLIDAGTSKSKL